MRRCAGTVFCTLERGAELLKLLRPRGGERRVRRIQQFDQ